MLVSVLHFLQLQRWCLQDRRWDRHQRLFVAATSSSVAFFISIGSLRRTVSAFHGAVYAGGRQAIFVVAGAIFEIAFEAVVLFEEFHTLGELRSAFKVR